MAIDHYDAGMNAYAQKRFEEAREWFLQGGDDPRCHYALGVLYSNGEGVARSFNPNDALASSSFASIIGDMATHPKHRHI